MASTSDGRRRGSSDAFDRSQLRSEMAKLSVEYLRSFEGALAETIKPTILIAGATGIHADLRCWSS